MQKRLKDQTKNKMQLKSRFTFLFLILLLFFSLLAALSTGAYAITPHQIILALFANRETIHADPLLEQARLILVNIRLPRVLLAVIVGFGFGAAGSALQALFRNPLADPGLIGVSSGAALGASAFIVLGPLILSPYLLFSLLPFAAFIGALIVSIVVYRLAASQGRLALPILLLAGIAINALVGAAIGLLTYIADDAQLRTLTFWNLGSLGSAQWSMFVTLIPLAGLGIFLLLRQRNALNALQLGESEAFHSGVPVQALKQQVLLASAMCVGALVANTGIIGFIGLVAPHCVRLICGPDQRIVMPGAMLFGAILAVLADLAARTIAAPAEIPLGILTALIGTPFFLILLLRSRMQL